MSKIQMMVSLKCFRCCNIEFNHLRLSVNAFNKGFISKIYIRYQYFSRVVCAYSHKFWKLPGCALIGACALIRTNTVYGSITSLYAQTSLYVQTSLYDVTTTLYDVDDFARRRITLTPFRDLLYTCRKYC